MIFHPQQLRHRDADLDDVVVADELLVLHLQLAHRHVDAGLRQLEHRDAELSKVRLARLLEPDRRVREVTRCWGCSSAFRRAPKSAARFASAGPRRG